MGGTAPVLVTGGAGYVGSHAVLALCDAGIPAVVLDDLSTGRRDLVPADVPFVEGDAGDDALVADLLGRHGIDTVMHFAGSIIVPDSVRTPLAYYRNNTLASQVLIEACVRCGVARFVFSSSAAVYGIPEAERVAENAPTRPINPYGRSKLMTEWMLADTAAAHGLRSVSLRYFNVAGADAAGRAGESPPVSTHLVKVACEAATGKRRDLHLYGEDYPTKDGTCIRDYVHVSDVADAHVAALRHLEEGRVDGALVLNVGYGHGYTVREVLKAVERAAGAPLPVRPMPRRAGDPPELAAAP